MLAVAEILGKVSTLVFLVAAARELGEGDFGAFAYALSFSTLVATLPSWGFDTLVIRGASADAAAAPRLLSESIAMRVLIATPVFLVAGFAGAILRPSRESAVAFVLVLAATLIDVFCDAGRSVATARQRPTGISVALVAQRLLTAVLAVLALVAGWGLVGLAAAYLAATVAGAFLTLVAVARIGIRPSISLVTRRGLRVFFGRSLAIGVNSVIAMALFRVDAVVLQAIKGDDAVGVYAAAYRIIETVMFLSWSISRAVFPAMSAAPEPWRVARGVEKGFAALATLYVPFGTGLALLAQPLLELLYGEPYASRGAGAARWLAPVPVLFALGYLCIYGLNARGREWKAAWGTGIAAAVNLVANLLLIPEYGGTAAGFTSSLAFLVQAALLLAFLSSDVGWVAVHRALAVPVAASAVMAGVVLALPVPVLVDIAAGGATYAVAWLLLARRFAPDQLAVMRSLAPGRS